MCFHNQFHAYKGGNFQAEAAQFFKNRHGNPLFMNRFHKVPVNIQENTTAYEIQIIAPGSSKSVFQVRLKEDILVISYQQPDTNGADSSTQWTHREHQIPSFERSFLLNNRVDVAAIVAKYEEGILKVILPKTKEAQQAPHNIVVA